MMTILLKRQEYLRATHLPRQRRSLAMVVASKLAAGTRSRERLYQALF